MAGPSKWWDLMSLRRLRRLKRFGGIFFGCFVSRWFFATFGGLVSILDSWRGLWGYQGIIAIFKTEGCRVPSSPWISTHCEAWFPFPWRIRELREGGPWLFLPVPWRCARCGRLRPCYARSGVGGGGVGGVLIARPALQDIDQDIGHQRPPHLLRPLRASRPVLHVLDASFSTLRLPRPVLYILYVLPILSSMSLTFSTSLTSVPPPPLCLPCALHVLCGSAKSFVSPTTSLGPLRPLRPIRPLWTQRPCCQLLNVAFVPSCTFCILWVLRIASRPWRPVLHVLFVFYI